MEDLLQFILTAIVSDKEALSISQKEENDTVTFTIAAHEEDIGKIIGKEGRTIKAIRTIVKLHPQAQNKWINIEIAG